MPRKLGFTELEPRIAPSTGVGIGLATFARSLLSNLDHQAPSLLDQLQGFVQDQGDAIVVNDAHTAADVINSSPVNPGVMFRPGSDTIVLDDLTRLLPLKPIPF